MFKFDLIDIRKSPQAMSMQFRIWPRFSGYFQGSRIEWLHWVLDVEPKWLPRVISGVVLVVLLLSVSGCAAQRSAGAKVDFYVGQGINVTECGPAAAAMLVNFSGGESSVLVARRLTKKLGLWTLTNIEQHLLDKQVPYQLIRGASIRDVISDGGAAVALMRSGLIGHFVVVYELRGDQVRVADPLFGMRWDNVGLIDALAVPVFVRVERRQ